MAHIRDFDPTLPDARPYIDKALALYDVAVRTKRGRVVFIAAELGGGKTDLLNSLAAAVHQAKPKPNFVAGSFWRGEYQRQTLEWEPKVCLKRAVLTAGETAALLGFLPSLYAFGASFIGQLVQTCASAHGFLGEFKKVSTAENEGAIWLRQLLRSSAEERPLVCLIDDWDEAQRFYWDEMLLTVARQISEELPLLMFITIKEPIDLAAAHTDESDLTMVIKTLIRKGFAELWSLPKLSLNEVATAIGPAAPAIAETLHRATAGNARWVKELWREWRLNETVVTNQKDKWIWAADIKPTLNLYDDILRSRLARLLTATTAMEVERAREVLACGALEGVSFTADAVALSLALDKDDLIDFLDETLVLSENNRDGLLLEDDYVKIPRPDGPPSTVWRYRFTSDLHWLALERHGFSINKRENSVVSERLEKAELLVEALRQVYRTEDRLVAAPLARLLREIGKSDVAQDYQRMADYSANRNVMREHALYLLAVKKDDWEQWQCSKIAKFLIEAGRCMINAFVHNETRSVLEEAVTLARRGGSERDEGRARYLCGVVLMSEGENDEGARHHALRALEIFERIGAQGDAANSKNLLSQIDFRKAQFDDARRHANHSLEIYRAIGYRRGLAGSLSLLAKIDYEEGRYDDARKRAKQTLKIDQETGSREDQATALHMLAKIDFANHRYDRARRTATESLDIFTTVGNQSWRAAALNLLAEIDYAEGRCDDARVRALQSLEIHREIGNGGGTADLLRLLAKLDYSQGRYDGALTSSMQALTIYEDIHDLRGRASSLQLLGEIAARLDRPGEAFDLLFLGVLILTEIGTLGTQTAENRLAALAGTEHYSEKQIGHKKQQVLDAYGRDSGKELIESIVAGLQDK